MPAERPSPGFRPGSATVLPRFEGHGIAIDVRPYTRADGARSLRLIGWFRVGGADRPPEVLPLQAIWILVVHGPFHHAVTFPLAGDAIVFEDDQERVGDDLCGGFEVDLFERGRLVPEPGAHFVSATLGAHLAPVIEARL